MHALQNHDELTYELVHWATGHQNDVYLYKGEEVTGAALAEAVRGDLIGDTRRFKLLDFVVLLILALVPILGIVIAAVPALFVALTTSGRGVGVLHVSGGWKLGLSVVLVLLAVQQLEARVLRPVLLGRSVRLHPVGALLALLIGGTLLGLWGMLLAVPVVAALRALLLHVWDTRSQWPPSRPEPASGEEGASPVPAPGASTGPPSAEPSNGGGPERQPSEQPGTRRASS